MFEGDRIDLHMVWLVLLPVCGHDVRRSLCVLLYYALLTMV